VSRTDDGFRPFELRRLRQLKSPHGVQWFVDSLAYHDADTAWSPRRVLAERTAHCLEGAIFAAAALRVLGHPPLIVDIEAQRDTDHVIAVFRSDGRWGAVAESNFAGLRFREPVYHSLRELVMSYFDDYFNLRRYRSMRGYSRPVNMARFDHLGWMTTPKPLWFVAEHLLGLKHIPLITRAMARRLTLVDQRRYESGFIGYDFGK
jgi:hypothetical protein